MRFTLLLALAVPCAPAWAQAPEDVVDPASGLRMLEVIESDEPYASLALGEDLLRRLNRPWAEAGADLVRPDSGAVEGGAGRLSWRVPDYAVDRFVADVEGGRLHRVLLDFSSEGPTFDAYADKLAERHGPPAPDGFYPAAVLRAPFDLRVHTEAQAVEVRASGDQTVGDGVVLPVQFRAAAPVEEPPVEEPPIVEVPDVPPAPVGGLADIAANTVYPADARAEGVGGLVVVEATVEPDGTVSDVTVLESPDPRLGTAAALSVQWTAFEPALLDGVPVRARLAVPVRFSP